MNIAKFNICGSCKFWQKITTSRYDESGVCRNPNTFAGYADFSEEACPDFESKGIPIIEVEGRGSTRRGKSKNK